MKWVAPSFLISIISIIAISLNNKFGWTLRPDQMIASLAVSVNFVLVTLGKDIALMKQGKKPTFNSTKLVVVIVSTLILGFSDYVGIDLDIESVMYITGSACAYLTGKGIRDIVATKKEDNYDSIEIDSDRV